MLSSDIRLFTWIDVEAVITTKFEKGECPEWIVWVRAYWDGLFIGIRPDKKEGILNWLSEIFDPRFDIENQAIVLESLQEGTRFLNVIIEETDENPPSYRFKPSLRRPPLLCGSLPKASPSKMPSSLPSVVAFHSFKGGVGRTLSALALARSITAQADNVRVLFIDADLEAPGVTWLAQKRFPNPSVSFADFLALLHGDPDSTGKESIDIVAERIREMAIDQIYILPAFRTNSQFASLEIRPEHLIQGARDPFILSEAVAALGAKLGVGAVIVDLRAGLSELSTGFLLDPRVFRVFVTTLSSQSIEGTCREMELVGMYAPSLKENEPVPALIFAQVPEDLIENGIMAKYEERVLEVASPFMESENTDDYVLMPRIVASFSSLLQVLPGDWSEVMKRISQAGMLSEFKPILEWLPAIPTPSKEVGIEAETIPQRRKLLAEFSKKLIYAETGTQEVFLSIPPLRHLASDYLNKIPVCVVIGAKGAGKTYTYLQVVVRHDWARFAEAVGVGGSPGSALICPVMKSKKYRIRDKHASSGDKK